MLLAEGRKHVPRDDPHVAACSQNGNIASERIGVIWWLRRRSTAQYRSLYVLKSQSARRRHPAQKCGVPTKACGCFLHCHRRRPTVFTKLSSRVPRMKHDTSFALLTGNDVETRVVKAGGTIFREGDDAHELFVIKSGDVRIQLGNRALTELHANDIFGEMALIDDEPRSATAVAITDVELVPVTEKQFLFLVSQTPYFALKVMRVLAQRLRASNKTFG